jgi:hypothetical protein
MGFGADRALVSKAPTRRTYVIMAAGLAGALDEAGRRPCFGAACGLECDGGHPSGERFTDGEARPAAASRVCGTSDVLAVNTERPLGQACARTDQMRPIP